MRHLINFIVFILALVIGAAFFFPSVIPSSVYRDEVQIAASDALGRDVVLAGDISFSLLPRIEVRAQTVSIENADGFGENPFAEMAEMRVAVKLMPLLSRSIEIEEFVLIDPVINLEQNRSGNNWGFGPEGESIAPVGPPPTGFVRRPGALPIETSFGDVRVDNALIRYSDGSQTREISGLDLSVHLPSVDAPMQISGALNADGEPLTFTAGLSSLRDFFEGRETPISLDLGGNLIQAGFDGIIPAGEGIALEGEVDTIIPSLRDLAAFAGSSLPPGDNLNRFEAYGSLDVQPGQIFLDRAHFSLDALEANGNLSLDLTGSTPNMTGQIDLPALDINPYLPADSTGDGESNSELEPWSETPIDLNGLHVLNTDIRVTTNRLLFRDIEVNEALVRLRINRGRMSANLNRFMLYGGTGSARVVANARGRQPSFSLNAQLEDLDALLFLQAAAGFDKLEGIGGINLDLLASGASPDAIMHSVSGSGNFDFEDGAIVGVNIAETIRNIQATISSQARPDSIGERQQTDFSELGGSFRVQNGIASNSDFLMLSPLLRVDGQGQIDLGGQFVDFRLRPRAVASIQGQGGDRDLQGIVVPIRMRGPFNDVGISVDTEAVGQALLSGAISNAIGGDSNASPEDMLRDGLLNALGVNNPANETSSEDTGEPTEEEVIDPAELLLRSLLNRNRNDEDDEASQSTGPDG